MANFFSFFRKKSDREKQIQFLIHSNFGVSPKSYALYEQALTHKSYVKDRQNESILHNERLEFLGDAVISSVVAEILFQKYPTKSEGDLTQMRSRIVSRQSLNAIGDKMGLEPYINYQKSKNQFNSLLGNTVESLVGALLLDFGYVKTASILKRRIFTQDFNFDEVVKQNVDYKSQLIIHCQKERKEISFDTIKEDQSPQGKPVFTMSVSIDGEVMASASGASKRKAEQKAARIVLEKISN